MKELARAGSYARDNDAFPGEQLAYVSPLRPRSSGRTFLQFRAMIRSDVSVYQIFQRFRLGKSEFPGRWTAKPYIPPPTPFPLLSFLTLRFCFLFRFSPSPSSFTPQRSRSRACISFPLHHSLGNWIVASNSAQGYGKEARSSIPLFLLLCLRLRRNFRIRSCRNFFFRTADPLLLRAGRGSSRNLFG